MVALKKDRGPFQVLLWRAEPADPNPGSRNWGEIGLPIICTQAASWSHGQNNGEIRHALRTRNRAFLLVRKRGQQACPGRTRPLRPKTLERSGKDARRDRCGT